MSGLVGAFVFLTRIPLARGREVSLDGAPGWFPVVGALVGLVIAGVYLGALQILPGTLAAVVAVLAGVWLTGAMHEDGLADTFDALGSGATGEDALAIMRDSRLGTFGTVAVGISLLWRVGAISSLAGEAAVAALVVAHTLGRTAPVVLMATTIPARGDGVGREGASAVSPTQTWLAVLFCVVVSSIVAGWWALPLLFVTGVIAVIWRSVAWRRLGGITGDVLGACEQVTESIVLACFAGAIWGGWSVWWA